MRAVCSPPISPISPMQRPASCGNSSDSEIEVVYSSARAGNSTSLNKKPKEEPILAKAKVSGQKAMIACYSQKHNNDQSFEII